MAIHLHLQNLSVFAANLDVRRFFMHYNIPEGGVQILGGPAGDAFITFSDDNDLLKAIALSGEHLLGEKVTLRIITSPEMEQMWKEKNNNQDSARPMPSVPSYSLEKEHAEDSSRISSTITKPSNYDYVTDEPMSHDYIMKNVELRGRSQITRDSEPIRVKARLSSTSYQNTEYELPSRNDEYHEKKERVDYAGPGFIKLNHLPSSVGLSELEALCAYYKLNVMPDGIVYIQDSEWNSAFLKLHSQNDALYGKRLRVVEMHGSWVDVSVVSEETFYKAYRDSSRSVHDNYDLVQEHSIDAERSLQHDNYHASDSGRRYEDQGFIEPGYIRISNLPVSVWYSEVRGILGNFKKNFGEITINKIQIKYRYVNLAFIEVPDYQTALEMQKRLNQTRYKKSILVVDIVSKEVYMNQMKIWETDPNFRLPEYHSQDTTASYIKISNIPKNITSKELQAFFLQYKLMVHKNGIYLKRFESQTTAFVMFTDSRSAAKAESLKNKKISGNMVKMRIISPMMYQQEKKKLNYEPQFSPKGKNGNGGSTKAIYLMIQNLSTSNRMKELKNFIKRYHPSIKPIIRFDFGQFTNTAYIKLNTGEDRIWVESFDCSKLAGKSVKMEKITSEFFEHHSKRIAEHIKATYKGIGESIKATNKGIGESIKATNKGIGDSIKATNKGVGESIKATNKGVGESIKATNKGIGESIKSTNKTIETTTLTNSTSREYFIKFDQLADDTSACEVWDWFSVSNATCTSVYVVRQVDNKRALFAYVAFGSSQDRNTAMAENQPCKSISVNKTYQHLASFDVQCQINTPTKSGKDLLMSEEARACFKEKIIPDQVGASIKSIVSSEMMEQANAEPGNSKFVCFMRFAKVSPNESAQNLLKQYGGIAGKCKGAVVVRKTTKEASWQTIFAFLAFRDVAHRDEALVKADLKRKWSAECTYRNLAQCAATCCIIECVTPGRDREVSKHERSLLNLKFIVEYKGEIKKRMKVVKKKPEVKPDTTPVVPESVLSQLIIAAETPQGKQLRFIRFPLDTLPEGATALGLTKWLGGDKFTSKGALLVCRANGEGECAFIAFDNRIDTQVALKECEGGAMRSANNVRGLIAGYGPEYKIYESTSTTEDTLVPGSKLKELQQVIAIVEENQSQGQKRKIEDVKTEQETNQLQGKPTKFQNVNPGPVKKVNTNTASIKNKVRNNKRRANRAKKYLKTVDD